MATEKDRLETVEKGPDALSPAPLPELTDADFAAPVITNHNRPEGRLKVESMENMGSMLDLRPECLNPQYEYRWVHKSPFKVGRAKARGYALVDPRKHEPAIVNLVGDSPGVAEDGTITVGDVVLMYAWKEGYKGRKIKQRKQAKQRLTGPERKFRKDAEEKGRSRYDRPVEVITDKE